MLCSQQYNIVVDNTNNGYYLLPQYSLPNNIVVLHSLQTIQFTFDIITMVTYTPMFI